MSDFSIIGVAIGLIFTFGLLSILTTSISTLISQLANTRAHNLKADLKDLIGDDGFADSFFQHPLINLSTPKPPTGGDEKHILPQSIRKTIRDVSQSVSKSVEKRQPFLGADYRNYRRWNSVGKFAGGIFSRCLV